MLLVALIGEYKFVAHVFLSKVAVQSKFCLMKRSNRNMMLTEIVIDQ